MPNTDNNQEHERFQPPPGGDVTLRSTDGIEFCVHSAILSVASSVFRDMLAVGTAGKDQVVDLTEDGKTVSLMLDFIYPIHKTPTILERTILHSYLEVARKYDLNAILEDIDAQLSQPTSKMFSDPLDLYKLSIEYALPNSRVNAARRLSGGEHNLLNPAFLSELSPTRLLDRNIVTIAAIQGARYKIITEALLHFDTPHWQLLFRNQHFLAASCEICQKLIRTAHHDASFTPLPGWAMTWTVATHKALAAAPLDQCLRFFDAGIFNTFENADFTCLACLSCLVTDRAERARESFNEWAIYPKDLLETQLAALDPLLHLIY